MKSVLTIARALWFAVALTSFTTWAEESSLFSQVLVWRESGRVIVSESDQEPRSIGSFSIRVYGGANPDFPFDDYQAGGIFSRDGVIESIHILDVNSDDLDDLVVVQRAVGSGGYRSADAFSVGQTQIVRIGGVTGVAPDVDLLELLKESSR